MKLFQITYRIIAILHYTYFNQKIKTMNTNEQIKNLVRDKYSDIAKQDKSASNTTCCGSCCGPSDVYKIMNDDYDHLDGYVPDADLGLGCGLPTEFAKIKSGDTVVDLGSGAGNDCFVARNETGPTGKVIGIDFTPAMIEKAKSNAQTLGYENVEFIQGDIEQISLDTNSVDVVVSNCVLNLVPDKNKVFQEIFRILKPGGHFSISDIVLIGSLPENVKKVAELYAGCVSGAIQKDEYLRIIEEIGFANISIQKEKSIHVPDDILRQYLTESDISEFRSGNVGIYSITVFAQKSE